MSNDINFKQALIELVAADIVAQNPQELKEKYGVNNLSETDACKGTRSLINDILLRKKKSRLVGARENLRKEREQEKKAPTLNLEQARDFLINLMTSGKLPKELTVAFRDGKDLPDHELLSMIEDLKKLGFDPDSDEQT